MQGFIDYITDRADGFEAFRERMEMRDLSNMASDSEPDTYACDCVFIRFFPTNQMLEDFPEIANDFLKHEFENIPKYDQVEYISDNHQFGHPSEGYITWILNLMMNALKQGSPYTIGLFRYLFQTYHKRDYKYLKRFRKISRYEIYDIADEHEDTAVAHMPVLITMCRLYGIELTPDCSVIYIMYEDFLDRFINEGRTEPFEGFSSETVDYAIERLNEEMKNSGSEYVNLRNKHFQVLKEGNRFIHEAEKWLALPTGFVVEADDELGDYYFAMLRTLEILKSMDPDREYSFEDIQSYALLLRAVAALGCYHDFSKEYQKRYFGLDGDLYDYEKANSLFDPDKIKIPTTELASVKGSGIKKEKASVNRKADAVPAASDTKHDELQELLDELDSLRSKVRKQDLEIKFLRDKTNTLDLSLKESESFKEAYKAEHEELVHLRNHVYSMTEEEQEVEQADSKVMENALKDKKIVIIGGHSNWIYKLKNKFSKWVFLKPEINNTFDGSVLADADYIYFFTDILSHGTYGKYMKIIRNQGMTNYGYIHSINVAGNIRQIYTDVCGD